MAKKPASKGTDPAKGAKKPTAAKPAPPAKRAAPAKPAAASKAAKPVVPAKPVKVEKPAAKVPKAPPPAVPPVLAEPPVADAAPKKAKVAKPAPGPTTRAAPAPGAEGPEPRRGAPPAAKAVPTKRPVRTASDDVDGDDVAVAAAEADAVDEIGFAPRAAGMSWKEAPTPAPAAPPIPVPDLPPRRADGVITLAHSPDADDAFMFYALANGLVDTEDRKYEHVLKDIQTLNEEAKKGTYDVTAISFHAYPYVRANYRLLPCGASFGEQDHGPLLVAKTPIRPRELTEDGEGIVVAIPGEWTTAALVTRLWFGNNPVRLRNVPFDKISLAVKAGLARAGVLIHEGQMTYREEGLVLVAHFGHWWSEETEGLPLPLGGNGIRRDIDKATTAKIALDLKRSIAYALGHRDEALAYAMKFARNLTKEKADKFVGWYVNELTLDYGERGRQAVSLLLERGHRAGYLAERVEPEFTA